MSAYLEAMRRSFDFAGRSGRSAYWFYTLTYFIILVLLIILDGVLGTLSADGVGVLSGIAVLVHLIPSLAVTVRRLHDTGRSGWWLLIGLVPLVGIIVLIVFACLPSQPGSNRFGDHTRVEPVSPAPAPAPAPQSPQGTIPLDQLEKLAALKASGAIDDDEFRTMKADLFAKAGRS
jgi:uncharacterized membrane protein YhaH (DUF805 family)|tara:strand:+ start:5973 stop:6500 length:528 start_codon:yes stop_codon:yes gene_type:complete